MRMFSKTLFLLMFMAIGVLTIKKQSFITPDGISPTLNTVEVHSTKSNTYITSSLWSMKKSFLTQCRYSFLLVLLMAGDIETQPGPSMKGFLKKRAFKILHNNINGILTKNGIYQTNVRNEKHSNIWLH